MNFLKDKKVLVTGGSGFVGTNLLKRLLSSKCKLYTTIHHTQPQFTDDSIEYINADLTNPKDCLKATAGIDYVFMCAANTSGAAVMENNPLAHLTPNILMNLSLYEAAYKNKVNKILFISSNTVYPVTDYPVKEDDVTNEFFHKYFIVAWMKRFTEIVSEMYSEKIKDKMNVVVVRPANLYGEFDDFEWETSHVIPALVRKVAERQNPINVWGDGKDLKEFLYIDDFIDGIILAMEKINSSSPINLSLNKPVTVKEIINHLIDIEGYIDAKVEYDTTKPTMIPKRLIDNSQAKKLLKFNPQVDIKEGLMKTLNWYKSRK
jgi:GDP-L-fucose synthase